MTILKRLTVFAAGVALLCLSFSASADEQYKLVDKTNPDLTSIFIYEKDLHFRIDKNDKSKLEIVDHKSDLNYAVFTETIGNKSIGFKIINVMYFKDYPAGSTPRKGTITTGYKIDYQPLSIDKDCPELRKDHLSGRLHPVWVHAIIKWKSDDEFTLGYNLCDGDASYDPYHKREATRIKN